MEGFKDPKKNITSSNEKCLYSGLFTSQGRIFCDAFLYPESSKEANSLLMECDLKIKDELITHLKKFKIRVKADILDASQEYNVWTVFGRGIQTDFDFIHHSSNRDVLVAKDPRLSSLGWRIVVPSTSQRKMSFLINKKNNFLDFKSNYIFLSVISFFLESCRFFCIYLL